MTSTTERPAGAVVEAYGLHRPAVEDLRRSLERIFGEEAPTTWAAICSAAGVSTTRTDPEGCDLIVAAMENHHDGAVRLCAESFQIRANAFVHLFKADQIVRSSE